MKMSFLLLIIIISLPLHSQFPDFEDYTKLSDDLYMKLIELGESEHRVAQGKVLEIDLEVRSKNDSLLINEEKNFTVPVNSIYKTLQIALLSLHEGDSAGFILPFKTLSDYFLTSNLLADLKTDELIKLNLKISHVQSIEEVQAENEIVDRLNKDLLEIEQQSIITYLESNKVDIKPEINGIYIFHLKEGTGPPVKTGNQVSIRYVGKFLNGEIFDDSGTRGKIFDFTYGSQLYLVEGLNFAVGRMREGGKARILIPSSLGFGETGSVKGIVPPYTPLLYEVEVLNAK